jgi:hypothetical protein
LPEIAENVIVKLVTNKHGLRNPCLYIELFER